MSDTLFPTSLRGAYARPGWWLHARRAVAAGQFGEDDIAELRQDAIALAVEEQRSAGLDILTDGEMGRLEGWSDLFGRLSGLQPVPPSQRLTAGSGAPQLYQVVAEIAAPTGLGIVEEFQLLNALAGDAAQAAVPGPLSLAERILPGARYRTPMVVAEHVALVVRQELLRLVEKGCQRIRVDEPALLSYPAALADLIKVLNSTFHGIRTEISLQLALTDYSSGRPAYARLFPAITSVEVAEFGLEFGGREMAESDLWLEFGVEQGLTAGVLDCRRHYVETPEEIAARIRLMLRYVSEDRLSLAPDGSLETLPRRVAWQKLRNLTLAAASLRAEVGAAAKV